MAVKSNEIDVKIYGTELFQTHSKCEIVFDLTLEQIQAIFCVHV